MSWYVDANDPTDEDRYYAEHASRNVSHWTLPELPAYLLAKIDAPDDNPVPPSAGEVPMTPTSSWRVEPPLRDESEYTPWAEEGWRAWNEMSPEFEFCEFAGSLVRLAKPATIVETGVGQGFTTRRMARVLGAGRLLACEADVAWRDMLRDLDFFTVENVALADEPTPTDDDFHAAALTVLDSDFSIRFDELRRWAANAQPGALLLVHDCGNGHRPDTGHAKLRSLIGDLGITGVFLLNPRGSFLGIQDGDRASMAALNGELSRTLERASAAETELQAIRASRSFRTADLGRRWLARSPRLDNVARRAFPQR